MKFDRIIYHHVPKTGGAALLTSLSNALKKADPSAKSRRAEGGGWGEAWDATVDLGPEFRLVSSHYSFVYPQEDRSENEVWIASWRDPVEMFCSAWRFYRQARIYAAMENGGHGYAPFHFSQIAMIQSCGDFEMYLRFCEKRKGSVEFGKPFPMEWGLSDWFDLVVDPCADFERAIREVSELTGLELEVPPRKYWNETPKGQTKELAARYGQRIREILGMDEPYPGKPIE